MPSAVRRDFDSERFRLLKLNIYFCLNKPESQIGYLNQFWKTRTFLCVPLSFRRDLAHHDRDLGALAFFFGALLFLRRVQPLR